MSEEFSSKSIEKILLSICIPTYNRCDHLKRQVAFLLQEISREIEIIISDNCSNDGTYEYLLSLPVRGNVHINQNEENLGAEKNMYKCIEMAKGQYIYLLGDDDYLRSGFIEKLLGLIKNEKCSYFHFNYVAFNEKTMSISTIRGIKRDLNLKRIGLSNEEITKIVAKYYSALLFMSSNVFRRELIINNKDNSINWVETLRLAILSMQSGSSYFDNSVSILCGVNTSWTDRRGQVWFESFPTFFNSLREYGFSKKQILYMKNHAIADCIFSYKRTRSNEFSEKDWSERINELTTLNILVLLFLIFLKRGLMKVINYVLGRRTKVAVNEQMIKEFQLLAQA
ncbi:glycosyltransferase family 2 protein [Pleomorphochaeta sp. DL1XJH-081]|uniref:glycosyltransferase family 2 protein n=1 Tax=Pleomorphochaeta sp. DL1XJH-081 TaxID=3409690 RepID=UPI003BB5248A